MGSCASTTELESAIEKVSAEQIAELLKDAGPEKRALVEAALISASPNVASAASLSGVTDPEQLGAHVAKCMNWSDEDAKQLHVDEKTGRGGGRVYIITKKSGEKVMLKIKPDQATNNLSTERMAAAVKAIQTFERTKQYLPDPLSAAGNGSWVIEKYLGDRCDKDRFHFDHEKAPLKDLAGLMAKIHQIPTDWYEPLRVKTIQRDSRLTDTLQKMQKCSHGWNPHAYGMETGCVFLPGKPNPEAAREILQQLIETGTFQKFLLCEDFYPQSEAGRRVVTLHGDFKTDNILFDNDSKSLVPIDFEFTSVGPAIADVGLQLICYLGGQWGTTYEQRRDFFKFYLEAVNAELALTGKSSEKPLDTSEEAIKALWLDAELSTLTNFCGLFSCIWDAQVPLLRGKPHMTPAGNMRSVPEGGDDPAGMEAIDVVAEAVREVRNKVSADKNYALLLEILEKGIVPVLMAKKVGNEKLWKLMEELQQSNMMRLFGLAPKKA